MMRSLLLPLLLLLSAGCAQPTTEQVLVGQVAALSGPDKARGQSARQGAALAVEELNAQQNGRRFTVLHADGRGDPDVARAQADRLAAVNRVVLVLSGTESRNPDALAGQTGPHGVPLLAAAEMPPAGEYAFTAAASASYQGQLLARFAAENLKASSAMVLTDSTSSVSLAVGSGFVREFRKGVATTQERPFKSDDDLPDLVNRVKTVSPAVVLVAGSPRYLLLLRARLHEAGVKVPLLLGGVEGSQASVAAERGPGAPVYLTTVYASDGLTPAGQEFARKYREHYGQEPDADAALAYDNLRLAAESIRRTKGTYGVRLREELTKLEDFESVTGPFAFLPDRSARRAVFVVEVQDGTAKTARKFDAEPK
jgi:branched-chain amino acid transport system substrate-binding protein